jgi:hypothetical protein
MVGGAWATVAGGDEGEELGEPLGRLVDWLDSEGPMVDKQPVSDMLMPSCY